MATSTTPKTPKTPKAPVALVDRLKTQLSQAALKSKVTVDELSVLEAHIGKLKSLLS